MNFDTTTQTFERVQNSSPLFDLLEFWGYPTYTGPLALEFLQELKSYDSKIEMTSHGKIYTSRLPELIDSGLWNNLDEIEELLHLWDEYRWETYFYGYQSLLLKYSGVEEVPASTTPCTTLCRENESLLQEHLRSMSSVRSAVKAKMATQLSSRNNFSGNATSHNNAATQAGFYAAGGIAGMVALALL